MACKRARFILLYRARGSPWKQVSCLFTSRAEPHRIMRETRKVWLRHGAHIRWRTKRVR